MRLVILAVLSASLGVFVSPASASQEAPTELAEAKADFEAGRYEAAIDKLNSLRETLTEPDELWEVYWFLGMSRLASGDRELARTNFVSAVRAEVNARPSEGAYASEAVDLYNDARDDLVGFIRLDSTPSGARATIGGRPVGDTPYRGPVLAGSVEVKLELEDYFDEVRQGSVLAGREAEFVIPMRLTPAAIQRLRNEQRDIREFTGKKSKKALIILVGAAGAAGVAVAATASKNDQEKGVQVDRTFNGTMPPFSQAGPFIANTRRSGSLSATVTWDNPQATVEMELRLVREFFETIAVGRQTSPTSAAIAAPVEGNAVYQLIIRNLTPQTTSFTVLMDFPR